ncbi:MAG: hypothetical protein WBC40_09970 [Halobacteriota archaeon]
MGEEEIDVDRATLIVKDYFEKVKGAKIKIAERPLIDWMNFTVNSVKEENGLFEVRCEFYETLLFRNFLRPLRYRFLYGC